MKKLLLTFICLLLCASLTACGDLTVLSRNLLLEETAPSSIQPPFLTSPSASAEAPDKANAPLYEAYSFYLPLLTEKERTIFLALYEGIMAFQESIPIPVSASSNEIKDLMAFLCNECPELLHLDSTWTERSNLFGNVTAVIPAYTMDQAAYDIQRSQIEAVLAQLHTQLQGADQYHIELTLFNHIINNCVYSLDAPDCQNAYGALVGGAAKCDGRAKALVWGLRSFGIISSVITGSNHAWVIARIGGYYYNVDPTYDDNETDGIQQPCSYAHFNVPETSILTDPYPADELFLRRGYPATVHWDHNYHVMTRQWIPTGQNAETAFLAQLESIAEAGSGNINLRFESAADYAAAKEASQSWIQTFLNGKGLRCSITSYDYSSLNTLFLQISF